MKACGFALATLLMVLGGPAYAADQGMAVVQDLASRWMTAYNNGDAGKVAELYAADATFLSGVLGALKGRPEIENAIAKQVKVAPKITFVPIAGHENGNVVWGFWSYVIPDGPSGHGAITAVKEADTWRIVMHVSNVRPKSQ